MSDTPAARLLGSDAVSPELLRGIRRLLDEAFGGAFSDDDWEHTLGGWHTVVEDGGVLVAHAAVVPRQLEVAGVSFRTGYVEGVATAPDRQGQGLGSAAMASLTAFIRDQFEFGALSTDRWSFYGRCGWERWQGPTFVRHGAELVRTEDEDDGVMALRFGPSAGVDLNSPITCEPRRGDDW